ncbi:unnamed protein product (macronuclear) [Paramecium tetraurelia]|uniref:Transmembrane protein n=1 Tax=Paramecium tetraurelia TaxID=5888 RepID=A0C0L3_PARTE|nr:uncharacterized protein GSPATT00006183001 [Paramecium tetraurelia]CAK64330.1 unnamed protein product [Paramecium tetraurelia]|eukprot:XP_001431728.1 hypothetical protein (macronuclear) [Paramecium tetraurelia strain d4-2]
MKQIVILFVLILFATASSDLLKSISKFADDGDNPSKFAKSQVSPFSEEESEDYDNDDTETSKKVAQHDDDDEEVDVMAQLKSYQQKLSTGKEVKPPQPQKKQVQVISESESEYDDEDDGGNMWSRGISKKLAQTESKPLVLPIQTAKEQIKNDFNQFTNLKMPEVQQRPSETKQDVTQKVQDDSGKDHSADFEKMKQAQLEKYSKRFHLDEPKESKSMYEDDSLKEFMPKINFQPINIQETKTSQQIQNNPEKKQEYKHEEPESESDNDEDLIINKTNQSSNKNNNKAFNDLQSTSEAFDFFNQNKQQQKSSKKGQKIEQLESEDEESVTDKEQDKDDDDDDYVQQVKKSKKQKEDREEQKRKQKQIQQQQEEEEQQRQIMQKKQNEKEELRKKQEEEERLQQQSKQQVVKRDLEDDQIPQKKKSKKQKKQLSLEEFQQSLKLDEEKSSLTSFAQKEAKEKAILEQKTFTLVKETPQQVQEQKVQEQKVFKLQVIPKKQQQFIQEEESESESESENDEDVDIPKSINCFESKNKFIQQICQLCQTKVAYQVNQQNWQKIGINDGFRQSFEPLIEFTFKSIGEIGSYYLSFKDHTVCLSAENLSKITNVDKVLKHFTGNQLADYNSPVDIPVKSQPINFLLSAEYDSLLNGFSCRRFQIAIKTDLKYKLSKKNDINVKQIIFYKNKLKLKYIGLIQINGVVHQASFDQEEGGEATNLIVTQLNLPKEQGVIVSLVDKYIDDNFVANLLQKSEQMTADLQIQTHIKNDDIGLTFNLRKKKGK